MRGLHTSAPEMIRALGPHLQALHIHDNDRHYDSHRLPFTMDIDFQSVIGALREVGYTGYLTLEADRHCEGCDAQKEKYKNIHYSRSAFASSSFIYCNDAILALVSSTVKSFVLFELNIFFVFLCVF